MGAKAFSYYKLSLFVAIFCLLSIPSVAVFGQTTATKPVGVPDDWTHHHVIYSDPGSYADAVKAGTVKHWNRITRDKRYKIQQLKRSLVQKQSAAAPDLAARTANPDTANTAAVSTNAKKPPKQTLKRDWSMDMGGYAATQTGAFTGSSGTGSVKVNGINLTASAGTAASQSTTVSANGVASGDTITITNPMVGSPLILTASAPTPEVDTLAVSGSEPAVNAHVTVAGIEYEFEDSGWTSGSEASTTCFINRAGGQSSIVAWLAAAISTGSANTGASTSTWECGSAATQSPTTGVTVTGSTSPDVIVTANTPGTTGFTDTRTGTNAPTITAVNGTNGSSTSPNFVWWAANAPAAATTVATNIKNAIGAANAVGVGATDGSGLVKITATLTGLAGNSISVATTIASGLTGAAFNGNLSGGASGTTSAAKFSTSTDSTDEPTDLANEAANLASAINTKVAAVTATSTGAVVTVTDNTAGSAGNSITLTETAALTSTFSWAGATLAGGATSTLGAATYPATFSYYSPTGNCDSSTTPDFAVYNTGVAGSATQASIIAYDNLYSGCGAPYPLVYWQYNTGGAITTNPIFSGDGSQMAFVQTNASSQAQLVLLKWSNGSTLITLTSQATAAAYTACGAPCMYVMTFDPTALYPSNTVTIPSDTYSSPFYDYNDDALYVGDDNGYVHQFTGVFSVYNATPPAETNTSGGAPMTNGWPQQTSYVPLSSPVYDFNSTNVFVGPAIGGNSSSAMMYEIPTTGTIAAVANGTSLGNAASGEYVFFDAPLVDPSVETVYAFVNDDGADTPSAAVWQLPVASFVGAPSEATVGMASDSTPIFIGAFDNIYEEASGPVGNLYVCGIDAATQVPALWVIPINNTMGTPVEIDPLTTATTNCSPITEFYNTSSDTDYIYLSVNADALTTSPISCTGGSIGCLMSFTVTSPLATGADTTSTLKETGGTSGVSVDNALTSPAGTSNVYFSPLTTQACAGNSVGTGAGTGGCAIQASQSALQ